MIGNGPAIGSKWVNLFWSFQVGVRILSIQIADFPDGPRFDLGVKRYHPNCYM